MITEMAVTALLAAGLAPCVLQLTCPQRAPHPPSSVCMHRIEHSNNSLKWTSIGNPKNPVTFTYDVIRCDLNKEIITKRHRKLTRRPIVAARLRAEDARAHKGALACACARVLLQALLRLPLLPLLLRVSLRLPQGLMAGPSAVRALAVLALIGHTYQASTGGCKNCITLGKEEKAMFRAHSDACLAQSAVQPKLVEAMLGGELSEEPALKRHVYCVLLKCKVISKDGKLQKTAVLGKMATRADARNATKVLEACADQGGETPEDVAWNVFRCGYDKKAVLFEYMPTNSGGADMENSSE